MKVKIRRTFGDDPKGHPDMGKIISDFHVKRLAKLIETSGGQVVYGGKINEEIKYIEPTILFNPKLDSDIMKEEIFGPIMPIIPFKSIDQAIAIIKDQDKPLAVYYYGNQNARNCGRLNFETSSGAFQTNECFMQLVSQYQGFGGVGGSGYGRYGGWEGYKQFSNRKGVLIKPATPKLLRDLALPPFTDDKINFLGRFLTIAALYNQSDAWAIMKVVFAVLSILTAYLLYAWYM